MTNFVLEEAMTWPERFSTAGIVTLEGMLTIFMVLAILWGVIEILHFTIGREKKAKNVPAPAPVAEEPAPVVAEEENNDQLIAVITAAVAAAMADEGHANTGFRVVAFHRINK